MPIYRAGYCNTCGEKSEYLLSEIRFDRENRRFVVGLLCPKCRDIFNKLREENGDFDAKID